MKKFRGAGGAEVQPEIQLDTDGHMPKVSPERRGTAVLSPELLSHPSSNCWKDTHLTNTYRIISEGERGFPV